MEQYDNSMGGVDLSDMLISLYRTPIKTKGWYLKVLFHCVDIVTVNAWHIYCRDCNQLKVAAQPGEVYHDGSSCSYKIS